MKELSTYGVLETKAGRNRQKSAPLRFGKEGHEKASVGGVRGSCFARQHIHTHTKTHMEFHMFNERLSRRFSHRIDAADFRRGALRRLRTVPGPAARRDQEAVELRGLR